jgi:hypothetical protein
VRVAYFGTSVPDGAGHRHRHVRSAARVGGVAAQKRAFLLPA